MRCVTSFMVTLLVALASAVPAAADDASTCNDARADRDASIAACTKLIDAGHLRGEILASVLHNRGKRWAAKRDYDRAYADFRAAFGHDPGSSDLLERNFAAAVITDIVVIALAGLVNSLGFCPASGTRLELVLVEDMPFDTADQHHVTYRLQAMIELRHYPFSQGRGRAIEPLANFLCALVGLL